MVTSFENSAAECRTQGRSAYFRFTLREFAGGLNGAAAEWIAKFTTDRSMRGRSLPDRLMMRPPGVPWEAYYGDALAQHSTSALPDEVMEAQRRTDLLVKRIVHAIAHHDFEGARSYSYQERQERESLRMLCEKYKCSLDTWQSA